MTYDKNAKLKSDTYDKLVTLNRLSSNMDFNKYLDYVINLLIEDHETINTYIDSYVKNANGKCINKVILGHNVIANHHFDSHGKCTKCGIQGPFIAKRDEDETVICIDNGVEQK